MKHDLDFIKYLINNNYAHADTVSVHIVSKLKNNLVGKRELDIGLRLDENEINVKRLMYNNPDCDTFMDNDLVHYLVTQLNFIDWLADSFPHIQEIVSEKVLKLNGDKYPKKDIKLTTLFFKVVLSRDEVVSVDLVNGYIHEHKFLSGNRLNPYCFGGDHLDMYVPHRYINPDKVFKHSSKFHFRCLNKAKFKLNLLNPDID